MNKDLEHLQLLSIFHYVVGGFAAVFACFPILHLVLGIVFVTLSDRMAGQPDVPPALIGWIFIVIASTFIVLGWATAVCIVLTGRYLSQRKHYLFCLIMAGTECLFFPFGTVLGVFTIVVLVRESVKTLFRPEVGKI